VRAALLASTLLSQGTPMLAAGDEFGHTQRGNNNAYCQDNETSWLDWSKADDEMVDLTSRLIALRGRRRCSRTTGTTACPIAMGSRPDLAARRRRGHAASRLEPDRANLSWAV
jgi:glycogen operon protein